MSPEGINIAIAESLGWTNVKDSGLGYLSGTHPDDEVGSRGLENYTKDLNAMREVEAALTLIQLASYRRHLACIFTDHPDDGMIYAIRATAHQRAISYLKTIITGKEQP